MGEKSMRCPNCAAELTERRRFCTECGTALPPLCSACGGSNPIGAKFCADCGTPIEAGGRSRPIQSEPTAAVTAPSPALTTAERRQITVMFCDLVGSTLLSTRL